MTAPANVRVVSLEQLEAHLNDRDSEGGDRGGRPRTRGDAEYRALLDARERIAPACDNDRRFTADTRTEHDAEQMRRLCRSCPLVTLCDAYARRARPDAGFWAGRTWHKPTRTEGETP